MYYIINLETEKLELHFDKAEYLAMEESSKREIKSAFLFSRLAGAWVSRSKYPDVYRAERVAKKLGAENHGKTGEVKTFAEKMEDKAERAEARAERYDTYAENAARRSDALTAPLNEASKDWAFVTQPNINTSAGRAFTNRRNKMIAAFDRGMEEFKKSEYFAERAEAARKTAKDAEKRDIAFCDRRIKECNKNIKAQKSNLEHYKRCLEQIESGHTVGSYTKDNLLEYIDRAEYRIESEISRACYYQAMIDDQGGIKFSKADIKPGYIVEITDRGSDIVEVVSCGPVNFFYKTGCGYNLGATYAQIVRIVKAVEQEKEKHPFKVGEQFERDFWSGSKYEKVLFEIVKATDKTVTILNHHSGKTMRKTPQLREGACYKNGKAWAVFVSDDFRSGYFKPVEA